MLVQNVVADFVWHICIYRGFFMCQVLLLTLAYIFSVLYILGARKLAQNVEDMNGQRPPLFFVICWFTISPLLIFVSRVMPLNGNSILYFLFLTNESPFENKVQRRSLQFLYSSL